jgi:general stress protein 26
MRVAMLTTVEETGGLRSRPMAVQEVTDEGVAWLFTSGGSAKVDEIGRIHHVNLCYLRPVRGVYVSMSGTAQVDRDPARIRELWHPLLHAWFPDGLDDPDLCLLKVEIEKADCWMAPVSGLVQVARYAGSLLGRTPRPAHEVARETIVLRGILGAAGGSLGVAMKPTPPRREAAAAAPAKAPKRAPPTRAATGEARSAEAEAPRSAARPAPASTPKAPPERATHERAAHERAAPDRATTEKATAEKATAEKAEKPTPGEKPIAEKGPSARGKPR